MSSIPSSKWVVVWTYGLRDANVSQFLVHEVKTHWHELLSVFCIPVQRLICLKVASEETELFTYLCTIPFIGGVLEYEQVKSKYLTYDTEALTIGSLVRVEQSGSLLGSIGRVWDFNGEDLIVQLEFAGKLVTLPFSEKDLVGLCHQKLNLT